MKKPSWLLTDWDLSSALSMLRTVAVDPRAIAGFYHRVLNRAQRQLLLYYWHQRLGTLHQVMELPLRVLWKLSLLVELWRLIRALGCARAVDVHRIVEHLEPFSTTPIEVVQMLLELGEQVGIFESCTVPGSDHTVYQTRGHAAPWLGSAGQSTESGPSRMGQEALQSATAFAELLLNLATREANQGHTFTTTRQSPAEGLLSSPMPGQQPLPKVRAIHFTAQINPEQYEGILESFQAFMTAELLWHQTQILYEAETEAGASPSLLFRTHLRLTPQSEDLRSTERGRPGTS